MTTEAPGIGLRVNDRYEQIEVRQRDAEMGLEIEIALIGRTNTAVVTVTRELARKLAGDLARATGRPDV